jgi:hypothetical protein
MHPFGRLLLGVERGRVIMFPLKIQKKEMFGGTEACSDREIKKRNRRTIINTEKDKE